MKMHTWCLWEKTSRELDNTYGQNQRKWENLGEKTEKMKAFEQKLRKWELFWAKSKRKWEESWEKPEERISDKKNEENERAFEQKPRKKEN